LRVQRSFFFKNSIAEVARNQLRPRARHTQASPHIVTPHPITQTMAPVRRYLRISKYSVLECRVYVEGNPNLADTWLLRKNDPALPRIVNAIRPLLFTKLREEKERAGAKGRGKVKKAIKDVIVQGEWYWLWAWLDENAENPEQMISKSRSFCRTHRRGTRFSRSKRPLVINLR
jgi:hypothetical protein